MTGIRPLGDPSLSLPDAEVSPLAERALEVLVTHNEAVSRDDLACALGVSPERAWEIAGRLRTLGRAVLDESAATVTATD